MPVDNQVVFGQSMGRFLNRGESKSITFYLDGNSYYAKITNVNYASRHRRKKDTLQIRYSPNSELSIALRAYFSRSYNYISDKRKSREKSDRSMIRMPDDYKEYLIIYTTEYDDTYLLETIVADDIFALKHVVKNKHERVLEASFNYDVVDENASLLSSFM